MVVKFVSDTAINDHTEQVFPNDLNAHNTMFGGKIVDIMDRLVSAVAKLHAQEDTVTSILDSCKFLRPVQKGDLLNFKVAVNRVWRTSMEVGVKVYAVRFEKEKMQKIHVVSAYFTVVAIDKKYKPVPIQHEVFPETKDEIRRFHAANGRREFRLSQDKYRKKS